MLDYFILFVSWVIYFFLHSVLASNHVKDQLIGKVFANTRSYRLFYAVVSTAGLLVILVIQLYLPSQSIIENNSWTQFAGLMFATFGLLIIKASFRYISLKSFIGLETEKEIELIRRGLHRKVRHPIYSGTILLAIGAVFFVPTDLMVISALSIFVYLPLGIMFEEEKLVKIYGVEYLTYKKTTPSILPEIKSLF